MDDRVDVADIGEELVAKPFALRRAAHQPGDIDEAELGFDDLGRTADAGDLVKARIGNRDLADIGFDRAKRIIRRLRRHGLRQCIEKRRLAAIWKATDAAAEDRKSVVEGKSV